MSIWLHYAKTGQGKTALGLNWLHQKSASECEDTAFYYSEQSEEDLLNRLQLIKESSERKYSQVNLVKFTTWEDFVSDIRIKVLDTGDIIPVSYLYQLNDTWCSDNDLSTLIVHPPINSFMECILNSDIGTFADFITVGNKVPNGLELDLIKNRYGLNELVIKLNADWDSSFINMEILWTE